MNNPSLEQAEAFMREAQSLSPGPWAQHSFFIGKAAEAIAPSGRFAFRLCAAPARALDRFGGPL
jgi:hypothetical protein